MSLRRLIVEVDPSELNVSAFCRQHGVSTWFFWDLRRRFERDGAEALEPRSRAPRSVANRTSAAMEDLIVAIRKDLSEVGLDAGPATIGFHLRRRVGADAPSDATIWRVLHRRGLVMADPSKAPKSAGRSFAAERANECWQIDDTPWLLADGSTVKIINIIDDCTRTVVASRAVPGCTAGAAFDAFTRASEVWGWPERFLSDNAKAFRHGLTDSLALLGVTAGHSRPYHPQTCGKVERFHQTLKRYLAAHDPIADLDALQHHLDRFCDLYNHHRPHRSLDRRYPADVWHATAKSGPTHQPLGATTQVHRVTVDQGCVRISRRYVITVGAAHNSQQATAIITGINAHIFIDGKLTRALTIDPTKRVQPLHDRPGRPRRQP